LKAGEIYFKSMAFFVYRASDYQPYSKSKLELESIWAKFCQFIASLTQLNLTKLKLE